MYINVTYICVCVRVCVCDFICPLSLDVCMCLASIRISASSGPWMFDDPCHVPLGDAVWGFQCVVPLASNNVHKSTITFASASCEHEGHKPIKTTPTYSDQPSQTQHSHFLQLPMIYRASVISFEYIRGAYCLIISFPCVCVNVQLHLVQPGTVGANAMSCRENPLPIYEGTTTEV